MPTAQNSVLINKQLQKLGFGDLKDPTLYIQFAACVRDHAHFRGILMHMPQPERSKWYEAMRPHLRFNAKPLFDYEMESRTLADQNQLPSYNPATLECREYSPAQIETEEFRLAKIATEAIETEKHEKARGRLTLVCTKCTVSQTFYHEQRKIAQKDAHEAGWRWDERNGTKRMFCPEHVPSRGSMDILCSKCDVTSRFRIWDEQDGYRDARRLGWSIAEDCICPSCLAKNILVQ